MSVENVEKEFPETQEFTVEEKNVVRMKEETNGYVSCYIENYEIYFCTKNKNIDEIIRKAKIIIKTHNRFFREENNRKQHGT